MAKKSYTIMVIPNITGKSRSFSIPVRLIKGLIFACILFLISASFLLKDYIDMSKRTAELKRLKRQALEQKIQIEKFAKKIGSLERRMVKLQTLDKKLRIITSLEKPQDKSKLVGIGGTSGTELANLDTVSKDRQEGMIRKMHDDLKQLEMEAVQQELSFVELEGFLRDQKSLLSSTPSIWPARGWVTSGFGYRKSPFTGKKEIHKGIDIGTRVGIPVFATADGIVTKVGRDPFLGNYIVIDHGYGFETRYGHNSRNLVKAGQKVKRWQKIATVGNTGRSTGPHLHYEVRVNDIPVNPFRYIIASD